jgi:hypothetical protein
MQRMTQILLKKKEEKAFNPLFYLGTMLKDIQKSYKAEADSLFPTKQKKKTVKIIETPKAVLELEDFNGSSP